MELNTTLPNQNAIDINYTKVREVKSPNVGTIGSNGMDLFVPNDFQSVTLEHGDNVKIPMGLKFNLPQGWALLVKNKSGVAVKRGLIKGAELIDSDYQGEFYLNLFNISNKLQTIHAGEKIVQLKVSFSPYPKLIEHSNENDLFSGEVTDRGDGGFGSTG